MLSYSIWFSAPSFWMGGVLDSRCVGRVYGADGAVRRHYPHVHHVGIPHYFNINVLTFSRKMPDIFVRFHPNLEFLDRLH